MPISLTPAVPIRRSVTDDHIVCLEDGKKLKMLKRHLLTAYGMTPEQYRARWGLPHDYPMVAPSYARNAGSLPRRSGSVASRGQPRRPNRNPNAAVGRARPKQPDLRCLRTSRA